MLKKIIIAIGLVTLIVGCGSKPRGKNLGGATPKQEALSPSGNPETYKVLGRTYRIMNSSKGYSEVGHASWYGKDFHGKRTSSGTPYNMHAYSAAHKTLPIPTYVRVTNLENGRYVTLRVDDRGPFVKDRVIDLSYTAAKTLDVVQHGTARVKVEALAPYQSLNNSKAMPDVENVPMPESVPNETAQNMQKGNYYIQFGSFRHRNNAYDFLKTIRTATNKRPTVKFTNGLYRVVIGTYDNNFEARNASNSIGYPNTIIAL